MTAIYSYFSTQPRCSFIAADNIEYTSGRKVDKLHFLEDRWIIACYGQDIAELSINAVTYFQGFDLLDFSTAERIIDHIIRATRGIAQRVYPEYLKSYQSGRISQEDWDIVLRNNLNVVILDTSELTLYDVGFGSAFPPSSILDSPVIRKDFAPGCLHRFALAERIQNRPFDSIDPSQDLLAQIGKIVEHDRIENSAIGSLGATVVKTSTGTITRTAFSGIDEYVASNFGVAALGFHLIVENYAGT
jgi:hypothetical protein